MQKISINVLEHFDVPYCFKSGITTWCGVCTFYDHRLKKINVQYIDNHNQGRYHGMYELETTPGTILYVGLRQGDYTKKKEYLQINADGSFSHIVPSKVQKYLLENGQKDAFTLKVESIISSELFSYQLSFEKNEREMKTKEKVFKKEYDAATNSIGCNDWWAKHDYRKKLEEARESYKAKKNDYVGNFITRANEKLKPFRVMVSCEKSSKPYYLKLDGFNSEQFLET